MILEEAQRCQEGNLGRRRDIPVFGRAVHKRQDTGEHLDPQSLDQPRHVLHEDADEERVEVLEREFLDVLVHDLASLELVVEEVDHAAWLVPALAHQSFQRILRGHQ